MITLRGTVDRITFRNDDNGFTVFRVLPESATPAVVCVGVAPTIEAGLTVVLNGRNESHKRYGRQFAVQSYEIVRPTTVEGIIRFLSSGLITSIGATRAACIVEHFGLQTLDVMDEEPERLLEVPGIGPKMLARIKDAWQERRHLRELVLFLQEFGVSLNLTLKIFKAYGEQAKAAISANPYALIEDIWGVGFKKADAIAQKLGFSHDSYKRIQAGLLFVLQEAAGEGHCYMPAHELTERAADVLGVDASLVVYSLDHAGQARSLVRDDDRIYVPHLYHAERRVAELIRSRLLAAQGDAQVREQVRRWVESYAEQKKWQLDPKQRDACVQAAQGSVFVLTGGPGTGKTTALHVLVAYLRAHNKRVAMAAPTGRAAQRMGTVAGMQARTIHRLLEFRPGGGNRFGRTAERPVEADVVIIDEVSMVDISLMRSLLEALDVSTRLVLVGDSNQLPSIGPGSVLADFIASGRIGHVELTTVFRQAARSRIVTTAHDIIRGRVCHFDNAAGDDCFFVGAEEPHRCLATVVDLACTRLPSRYGFNPRMDIQILAPMHRGELGTQNINRLLQERLSSGGISYTRGEATYTTGDRVMQIRNNYDRGVFNGDIGYVTHITENGEMMVDFEGTSSVYEPHELDEITLAYCISIHKSQGCEFRGVIIPLGTQHYIMLRRNLVYTALTRARQLCVFVGSSRAFAMAVRNGDAMERYSRLGQRIRGEV